MSLINVPANPPGPMREFDLQTLQALEKELQRDFDLVAANKLALNLSRGKPAADQVSLSNGLEDTINGHYTSADGIDTRNYGEIRGISEARLLGQEIMGVPASNILAGGNSSLFLMHTVISLAMHKGLWGDARNWREQGSPKLLTPVPGYDRHYALTESLGIDMINIDMTDTGPNLDQARSLIAHDPSIKGIWCVPKYSNPTGCIYSDETVKGLAELANEAAADDFVVLWDNAYAVHDLVEPAPKLASIFELAQAAGSANHIVQFGSTSKITFAGAGIAFIASAEPVLKALENHLSFMMIGPDKVNQLRHSRFLNGRVTEHMQAHASLLKPKFAIVAKVLAEELASLDIATWNDPAGGYFVSLNLIPGLAKNVVGMAASVGLTLTPAGAPFPYGIDPNDQNVRIAPTFATPEELLSAMQILALCVKLASVRKFITNKA